MHGLSRVISSANASPMAKEMAFRAILFFKFEKNIMAGEFCGIEFFRDDPEIVWC